jgi:hypothetical protein
MELREQDETLIMSKNILTNAFLGTMSTENASIQHALLSKEMTLRNISVVTFENTSSSITSMNDSISLSYIDQTLKNARTAHFIAACVFGAFFSLFAIFGNAIVFYGLGKSRKMSSTSRHMIFQSIVDVMVCILYFIQEPLSIYYPDVTLEKSYGQFYSYFASPVFSLLIFTSNWNLALTTADRYFKVCQPSFAKVCVSYYMYILVVKWSTRKKSPCTATLFHYPLTFKSLQNSDLFLCF